MHEPTILPESIEKHYTILNGMGRLGPALTDGFFRAAYSDEETAAMQYVEKRAMEAGLSTRWDAIGNLVIERAGLVDEWVETGSHVDTVFAGGNFDGLAGVVAGLEVLLAAAGEPDPLRRGLRLRVWRGEESASFGVSSLGSRAAFGQLSSEILAHPSGGRTLKEAMLSQGADPDWIAAGRCTVSAQELDAIAAHIELHIEQGRQLASEGKEIGIVTGIRGACRSWVTLRGEFDHSGATPMGADYRRDVNLALAYIMVDLDRLAGRYEKSGKDLVQTVGLINSQRDRNEALKEVYENAMTKVSGFGYFSHEARSRSVHVLRTFCDEAGKIIEKRAARLGVSAIIEEIGISAGIESLDINLQSLIEASCMTLGCSFRYLPSGAWHDAAVVASQKKRNKAPLPVGMIFIPCREGISHNGDEYASPTQIATGASVLARSMLQLARS